MTQRNLKIMQINVCGWKRNKLSVQNALIKENIDIALINEHGMKINETIKISSYNVFKTNTLNESRNGCAIAIKQAIEYRIDEDYESDMLSVEIDTTIGPITIATSYIPPRVGFMHYPCLLYTSPSPRDKRQSRMPSSA